MLLRLLYLIFDRLLSYLMLLGRHRAQPLQALSDARPLQAQSDARRRERIHVSP